MLTDRKLRALAPRDKFYELADREGLSVRVSPAGRITFQYRYRIGRRAERLKIGTYPGVSLAEARIRHGEARKLVAAGQSPARQRQAAIRSAADAETVKELAKEFLDRFVRVERRRPQTAEQMIEADVIPKLGPLRVRDVTRRDVIRMLDAIVDRGAPVQANRTAALVKQMFRYAVERGMIDVNPCGEIRRQTVGGTERPRERVLSAEEIKAFWGRLPLANQIACNPKERIYPVSKALVAALRLLLVTAQRRGELVKAKWSDVNLDEGTWTIPAENSKNGRAHRVPLSPLAVQLFQELKVEAGESQYVLPTPHTRKKGDAAMTERSLTKAAERAQQVVGIDKWVPHDLRRTSATGFAELGVPPQVIERILNHTMQGILAVYNRHDYFAECKEALNRWALQIRRMTSDLTVVDNAA